MNRASRKTGLLVTLTTMVIGVLIATAAPAQAATVVARWNMEDSGGTMADATGRGHTGTLHGVTVRQPGQSGYGYGFSRTPAYVTVPSAPDLSPGTQAIRITASIRFSALPSASVVDYDLVRKGLSSTAGGDYKMEILSDGRAFCLFRGSAGQVSLSAGPNLATNSWHTVTCARSGGSVVLTVDGASYSKAGSTGSISNSSTVYIGAKNTSGEDQYRGLMDSVSITLG